ncbi:MAG TPA: hypothetical protein VNB64_12335 [Solirubrobacteraceae bacterium]|nr:hypothetical protein [Solirubrobacteraceae bacterium]
MWSKLRPTPSGVLALVALMIALGAPAAADPVADAARDLVTREEIATSAVRARHIGNRQVLGRHVRSRTLTLRTLARGTIAALRRQAPAGIDGVGAGGDLTGAYPDPRLRAASVGTFELANLAVTAPKLANGAVTAAKLAPDAVGSAQLADDSVTSAQLADDSVTNAQLADDSVTTAQLADNSVTTAQLANAAVTLVDLAVASVDSARVVDESLQAVDLGPGSVGSSEVIDQSLTASDLGLNSVASGEIADNTVTEEDLAASSVGQGELQPFSVTPQKLTGFPAARVSRVASNGEQSIAANASVPLSFFTARFEKGGAFIHDNSTPTRLTAPAFGTYLVTASVLWEADADGRRELALRYNGSNAIAADTESASSAVPDPFQTVTAVWTLAAGDYVEVLAQQTNAGNDALDVRITSGGAITSPEFSLVYLGP